MGIILDVAVLRCTDVGDYGMFTDDPKQGS